MNRLFFNILCKDLEASKVFYTTLLEMTVHFNSDWFVILKPSGETPYELGLIDIDHQIVPAAATGDVGGTYPTFVVDDVEIVYQRAQAMGVEIIEAPKDMFYGQRRMLLRAPDGLVLDISSLSA